MPAGCVPPSPGEEMAMARKQSVALLLVAVVWYLQRHIGVSALHCSPPPSSDAPAHLWHHNQLAISYLPLTACKRVPLCGQVESKRVERQNPRQLRQRQRFQILTCSQLRSEAKGRWRRGRVLVFAEGVAPGCSVPAFCLPRPHPPSLHLALQQGLSAPFPFPLVS